MTISTVNWTLYSKNQVIEICETQSRIVGKIAECVINRRIPDAECRIRIIDLLQKLGVLSKPEELPPAPALKLVDGAPESADPPLEPVVVSEPQEEEIA